MDLILQNGEVFKMNQREHLRDKKIIHDSSFEMIETKISHFQLGSKSDLLIVLGLQFRTQTAISLSLP